MLRKALLCFLGVSALFAQGDVHLFDYDEKAALDYQETEIKSHDGVTVYDASFVSPLGGRVVCYRVAPTKRPKSKLAGVVWQHGGGQDRQWFLPEAMELARAGAESILLDAPANRPDALRAPVAQDNNGKNVENFRQVAVDIRRAFDALAARPEVDPQRIGYAGLSFGAMLGGSLAGIDHRFRTFVLISGLEGFARHFTTSAHPAIVSMRAKTDPDEFDRLVGAIHPLDAINYIGHASVPLLFQAARFDVGVTESDTYDFYKAAPSPKDLRWYDSGHMMTDRQSAADRIAWFRKYLKLT